MSNALLNGVAGRMSAMLAASQCAERCDADLLNGFIARRDQTAFEAIVRRHGPMVLAVCQRLLGNTNDAEDAFQATFIVLMRKAGSLRRPERLAGWLYQVAYRIARKARRQATVHGHRFVSGPLGDVPVDDPVPRLVWNELRPIFDDELNRLPEKLRLPVLLCFMQGLSKREAARRLAWPEGTLSSRLQTAREALRIRLNARGLALSAGVLNLALFHGTAPATIPATLFTATATVACESLVSVSTCSAMLLADGVIHTMFQAKLKMLAVGVLSVFLLGGGVGWFANERGVSGRAAAQGPAPSSIRNEKTAPDTAAQALVRELLATSDANTSDEAFVRRVYLDVLGRLPTVEELRESKKKLDEGQRSKLIDWLTQKPSDPDLAERIAQYEKAFRAQSQAPALAQFVEAMSKQNGTDEMLFRGLWLDLFGLPPTVQEIEDLKRHTGVVQRLRQLQQLSTAEHQARQFEIEALRARLRALEAQLAEDLARRQAIEALRKAADSDQQKYLRYLAALAALNNSKELASKIARGKAEIEMQTERVQWSERMLQKGYMTRVQVEADRARLAELRAALKADENKLRLAQQQESVRKLSTAVDQARDSLRAGKGSEAASDRAQALLAEARIELARLQMRQELENLIELRQREVDRIAKAVAQKLLPAEDLEKARKALDDARKRLAELGR